MVTNLLLTASLLSSIPTNWNSNVEVRFRVVDDAGLIVSNAVISTNTQRDRLANLGHADSPQRKIIAITDTNGCARIEFPCYSGEFSSQVSGERIYSEHKKDVLFKYARDSVYFAHLLERVQRDIYAESKGFSRRERKGSCRAVDLPQVSDEVGEELLEAVRLVEGAQRQQRLRSLQRPEHS